MTKVTGFSEKELAESVTACDEVSVIYEIKKIYRYKNKLMFFKCLVTFFGCTLIRRYFILYIFNY